MKRYDPIPPGTLTVGFDVPQNSRFFRHVQGFAGAVEFVEIAADGTSHLIWKNGFRRQTSTRAFSLKSCLNRVRNGIWEEVRVMTLTEKLCRAACKAMGVDPDAMQRDFDVALPEEPQWKMFEQEIKAVLHASSKV